MTTTLATLETTSSDVVKNLYTKLPTHDEVYNNGVDPTPTTPADKNSVWFVLGTQTRGLGQKLRQRMNDRLTISQKQWYWAVKIAGESLQPKTAPVTVDANKAKAWFDKAESSRLMNPSVHMRLADGSTVVVKRCGNRTHNRSLIGTLKVTDDANYPRTAYFGRIGHDGTFQPSRRCSQTVVNAILDFADDPAGVAAAYGKLTGNCCFCRKALSDPRSTAAGYGQTCSKNWNLPWG